jgi:hypothetical protein
MKSSIATIQPSQASQYLNTVRDNRNVSQKHIRNLTHSLKDNRWMVNGESIKFADDDEGNSYLMDGQHRMLAVVQSGIPMTTVVIEGLDPLSFPSIDSGKRRSLADVLSILDFAHPSVLSGGLNILDKYYNGGIGKGGSTTASLPNETAESLMHRYPDMTKSAALASRMTSTNPISAAISCALHYVFAHIPAKETQVGVLGVVAAELEQEKDADSFFLKLGRGLNLTEDCPIRRFREVMLRHKQAKVSCSRYYTLSGVIKAWNHWRKGTQLKRFVHSIDGKASSFPKAK